MRKLLLLFLLLSVIQSCTKHKTEQEGLNLNLKYKGISVEAPESPPPFAYPFASVQQTSANSVAIIPFGIVFPGADTVKYDQSGMWWGETTAGFEYQVQQAKDLGMKVLVKPQVWFVNGTSTLTYDAGHDTMWSKFEESYTNYITHFAVLADTLGCEMFSVGTEFSNFAMSRSDYWTGLIADVRNVYSGDLTYAANWDSYTEIPFWSDLDYIGVDAYFPISDLQTPSVYDIKYGWKDQIVPQLKATSATYDLPLIFTEYGYRPIDYSAENPWDAEVDAELNYQAQSNALLGMFLALEGELWFEGGFLWKWHLSDAIDATDKSYTPQNKPAEQVINSIYSAN